jgi:PAS domain S-box-containing protein
MHGRFELPPLGFDHGATAQNPGQPLWRARLAAGVAVLCVLLLTVWQGWSSYQETIEDMNVQTDLLTRIAEEHVTGMMRGVDLVLGEVAGLVGDDERMDPRAYAELMSSRMKQLAFVRNGFVANSDGVITNDTLGSPPNITVRDRDYFSALAADPSLPLYISAPLPSRARPVVSIFVVRPIRSYSGKFLGVAAIAVDPRLFEDELNAIRPPQGGFATLLRTEGTVLSRVPDAEKWSGKWLGDGPVIQALGKAPRGILHGPGRTDGADRIVAYRQLQLYPLVVAVGMRTDPSLAKWRNEMVVHGLVGLVLVLVLTGLAVMSDRGQAECYQAQLALAASEGRFRRLSDRSPVGIVLAGPAGDCRYANQRWLDIVGRPVEMVVGRHWFDAVAIEDRPAIAAAWAAFADGGDFLAEMRVLTLQGVIRWVRGRASRLAESDDEGGLVATFEDISAAKEAEQRLLLSEDKFAKAFRASPDALTISTLAGGAYVDVNAAFCRMLGYDRSELMGSDAFHLGIWGDATDRSRVIERVRRDGQVEDFETMLRRKDGLILIVLVSVQRIDVGGEPCLLFICRDVSERRAVEARTRALVAKLDASNQELEQFAYVASHDLQEPLRMVAGYAQLIERRYRGQLDSDADEFIDFLVDGAKRMQAMIHDLLEYSRVERLGGAFSEFEGKDVLEDVRRNLAAALAESGGRLGVGALPRLHGDRSQIVRLFQNLIGNALKYRHPDRQPDIAVEAEAEDGGWMISVSDNGIGIESQYFERIFMVFQRLHTREKYPGTGIGLAICKKIVERHGGRLSVESEPDRGSIFRVWLPSFAAHAGSPAID